MAERARKQIVEAIGVAGIDACVSGAGSMLRVHLKSQLPRSYREAFCDEKENRRIKLLLDYLLDHGIIMINTCSVALSTAMSEEEVDILCSVMLDGFRKLKMK